MAIKLLAVGEVRHITHPDDKENPTVFTLQPTSQRVDTWVRDQVYARVATVDPDNPKDEGHMSVLYSPGLAGLLTMATHLRNIENLQDADGKPVVIKRQKITLYGGLEHEFVDPVSFDHIPPKVQAWLLAEINKEVKPTGEDAGK